MINITEMRVRLAKKDGSLKATVSMTIDGCFVVHDIKIIEDWYSRYGFYIAMPDYKTETGKYKDFVYPTISEFYTEIQKKILTEYKSLM